MRILKLIITLILISSSVYSTKTNSVVLKSAYSSSSFGNLLSNSLDSSTFNQYFVAPPANYRLIQYYMSNDPATQSDEVNAEAVAKFKSFGIGGLQQSVNYKNYLESDYLWQQLADNIDKARAAGFRSWIHDEQGYPSGMAGGKVVRDNPELESLALTRLFIEATGLVTQSFSEVDNITFVKAVITPIVNGVLQYQLSQSVPIINGVATTSGLSGKWRLSVFGTKLINSNSQAQSTMAEFGHLGRYPNLLDKNSTLKFLEITHQRYATHVPNLSQKVELFYTGEPNLQCIPWNAVGTRPIIPWQADLPQIFNTRNGYDLLPYLDALFGGTDELSKSVRLHFYQTIAYLFSENYAKSITTWCGSNNVNSMGHLLLEEYFAAHVINYGDAMQVWQNFHVPMCDLPVPQPTWTNSQWEIWMPKLVSSAAYLQNKEMVVGLLDPVVMGNSYSDLTPEINRLKRTVNMAILTGINQFASWIPLTSFYNPESYSAFNNYMGRMCLMLRGAKNEASIAMYYPIETFQANYIPTNRVWTGIAQKYAALQLTHNSLAGNMLRNGMDYNYLTAKAILDGVLEKGFLKVGNHNYSVILMPSIEVLSLNVLNKLIECETKGVKVLWVDALPKLGATIPENEQVVAKSATLQLSTDTYTVLDKHKPTGFNLSLSSTSGNLSIGKYSRNKDKIYIVVNDLGTPISVKIESQLSSYAKIYQPNDGSVHLVRLPYSVTVKEYESIFVIETEDIETQIDTTVMAIKSELTTNPKQWRFEPVSYLIYNKTSNSYLTGNTNGTISLLPKDVTATKKNQFWTIEPGIYDHILIRNRGTGLIANNYCSELHFDVTSYLNVNPIIADLSTLINTGGSLLKLDENTFFPQLNQFYAINSINWYSRSFVANTSTTPHSVLVKQSSQVIDPKEWRFEEVQSDELVPIISYYNRIKNTISNKFLSASTSGLTVGLKPADRNTALSTNQVWTVQSGTNESILFRNVGASLLGSRFLCFFGDVNSPDITYLGLASEVTAANALMQLDNNTLKNPFSATNYSINTINLYQRTLVGNKLLTSSFSPIRFSSVKCLYANNMISLRGIINRTRIEVYDITGVRILSEISSSDIDIPINQKGLILVNTISDLENATFKIITTK